jgi:hypothetical protein
MPPPTTEPAPVSDTAGQVGRAGITAGKKKKRGQGDVILAPVPFSNPTIETGLGLGVGYIFHPDKKDTVSPPSTAMLGGIGSTNGTKGGFLGGKLFLKQDHYRVAAGYAYIDARYDFYGIGSDLADQDIKVPLGQKVDAGVIEGLARVAPHVYAGLAYSGGKSTTTVRGNEDSPISEILSKLDLETDISNISPRLETDRRDNQFFPTKGDLGEILIGLHDPAWGDSFSYQSYLGRYSGYHPVGPGQVLAYLGTVRFLSGSAPFFALSQIGAQDQLRGYVTGKYRDKDLLSAQAEYRRMFPNRFGFVVFGGASEVAKDFSDLTRATSWPLRVSACATGSRRRTR